jgi:adenosylcobinamide-phosphate synthase
MVGYRNDRYLLFGRASAKLDDMLNFIPARLAAPVLFVASAMCGLNGRAGWRTALRDRLKHESPNSAHTESFAAGALGIRLGGPLQYPDGRVEKPWMGDGTPDATAKDILSVCRLVLCAGWISALACMALLLILGYL